MSRLSLFNSPLLLGFEEFERRVNRITKMQTEGYPPYNIEQTGKNQLRITLAVAGFSENELFIHLEDNQLVIGGNQDDGDESRDFLHRGIAARQFQRSFILAEGIEILKAHLNDGLLHIDLEKPPPEPQVRTIPITTGP